MNYFGMDFESLVKNWVQSGADAATLIGSAADAGYSQGNFSEAQILNALKFVNDYREGKVPPYKFMEAMSTSDFPLMFGQIIDRKLTGDWAEYTPSYESYVEKTVVNDFKKVDRFYLDGLEGPLPELPELTEPDYGDLDEGRYQIQVASYARAMAISWQAQVNDDLGAFESWPKRFISSSNRTGLKLVTQQIIGTTGLNTTLFTAENKNIVNTTNGASADNPPLSRLAINEAIAIMKKQETPGGDPIEIGDELILVTGRALTGKARQIIQTTEYREADGSNVRILSGNGLHATLRHVENPYMSKLPTSNGDTTWCLINNPASGRPALMVASLRGVEAPVLYQKVPDRQIISGGGRGMGSFNVNDLRYGVVYVVGAAQGDPRAIVGSNGSNA